MTTMSTHHRKSVTKTLAGVAQWVCCGFIVYAIWAWALSPNISNAFFAYPGKVFDEIGTWLSNGTAWSLASTTLAEALAGFAIGSVLGIIIALAIGLLPQIVGEVFEPFVTALYTAPKFVFIPLLFIWLGADFSACGRASRASRAPHSWVAARSTRRGRTCSGSSVRHAYRLPANCCCRTPPVM